MTDTGALVAMVMRANPRTAGTSGPKGEWSSDDLLLHVTRRSLRMDEKPDRQLENRTTPADRQVGRKLTRTPLKPRRRLTFVAVGAAVAIAIIAAVVVTNANDGADVAASRVLTVTIDGNDCRYDGPAQVTAGDVEIVYHNQNADDRWANTLRIDPDHTLTDVAEYVDQAPLAGPPPWSASVFFAPTVRANESRGPNSYALEEGLHVLVCGDEAGGAVIGGDLLVTP